MEGNDRYCNIGDSEGGVDGSEPGDGGDSDILRFKLCPVTTSMVLIKEKMMSQHLEFIICTNNGHHPPLTTAAVFRSFPAIS